MITKTKTQMSLIIDQDEAHAIASSLEQLEETFTTKGDFDNRFQLLALLRDRCRRFDEESDRLAQEPL